MVDSLKTSIKFVILPTRGRVSATYTKTTKLQIIKNWICCVGISTQLNAIDTKRMRRIMKTMLKMRVPFDLVRIPKISPLQRSLKSLELIYSISYISIQINETGRTISARTRDHIPIMVESTSPLVVIRGRNHTK